MKNTTLTARKITRIIYVQIVIRVEKDVYQVRGLPFDKETTRAELVFLFNWMIFCSVGKLVSYDKRYNLLLENRS